MIGTKDNIGLIDGLSGKMLTQFIASDYTDVTNCLKSIEENIEDVYSLNYSNGLLGIFWSLSIVQERLQLSEFLLQSMREFDDFIYRSIVNYLPNDLSVETGLLGKGLYLYRRIRSDGEGIYYRRTLLREVLVLLIQGIAELIPRRKENSGLTTDELCDLAKTLSLMVSFKSIGINPLVVDDLISNLKSIILQNKSLLSGCSRLKNVVSELIKDNGLSEWKWQATANHLTLDLSCYTGRKAKLIKTLSCAGYETWHLL